MTQTMNAPAAPRNAVHARWATIQGGRLDQWVVVAYGTLDEFAAGRVGGFVVAADEHCTPDCPGVHA